MSILDKTEKVGEVAEEKVTIKEDIDLGYVLVITYCEGDNELFHLENEKQARTALSQILAALHSVYEHGGDGEVVLIGSLSPVDSFKGMVVIDETVRAVRILDPRDLPSGSL